eukprot:TRINITY_DN18136_c0_g2_i2.p1 TRINITY_DN18136_c0_g2~~TRINITY_DN18136_c0_g2_i2.p1  ORF type:complete len:159 (-),score=33.01 TRINITY_DN18136_c0_g2_i2:67-516(-)
MSSVDSKGSSSSSAGGDGGGHTFQLIRHHRSGNAMYVAAHREYFPLHVVNFAKGGSEILLPESLASITEVVMDATLYIIFKQDWSEMDRADTGSVFRASKYDGKVIWWRDISNGEFRSDHMSKEEKELMHALQEWYRENVEAPYYDRRR